MTQKTYRKVLDLAIQIQDSLDIHRLTPKIESNPVLEEIYAKYFYMLNHIFSDDFGYKNAADIDRFIFDGEGDRDYIYNLKSNDYTS